MKLLSWGITDVGLKRKQNQDTILMDPDLGLYIVADGMGGHKGGEVASAMACELIQKSFKDAVKNVQGGELKTRVMLYDAYEEACRKIFIRSNQINLDLKGMGTTVVSIAHHGDHIYIGNVGDSRAYLYRMPQLWPLTEDHSLTYEQMKEGEKLQEHVGKNVITRSVGYEREVITDVFERKITIGDKVLLCSDGLCGFVADTEISRIFKTTKSQDVPKECIKAAHKTGGADNISAIVLEVVE